MLPEFMSYFLSLMDKNHDWSCKIIFYITHGEMAESG